MIFSLRWVKDLILCPVEQGLNLEKCIYNLHFTFNSVLVTMMHRWTKTTAAEIYAGNIGVPLTILLQIMSSRDMRNYKKTIKRG